MANKKNDSGSPSGSKTRAEQLIEDAVRAVEAKDQNDEPGDGELVSKDSTEVSATTGPIAKIDVQQLVEKEAYLRLAADFSNFRSRALKDRQDSERMGKEKVLASVLDIFDNLERGVQQAKDDSSPLATGMRMVLSQFETWFQAQGLQRVETVGQPFDPLVHEAIAQKDAPGVAAGMVIEEVKRGYRFADRLLRPSLVVVSKGSD